MEDFLEQRTVNWTAKDAQDSERCGERQIHCGNQGDKRDGAVGTEEERRHAGYREKDVWQTCIWEAMQTVDNPSSRGVNQSAVSLLQTWNLGENAPESSTSVDCIETYFGRVPGRSPALAIMCLVFTAERAPTKETVGNCNQYMIMMIIPTYV